MEDPGRRVHTGPPCVRYQVRSPLSNTGEGSALPSVMGVTQYLEGAAGSCSCLWQGFLGPTPPGAHGFPDLLQRLRAPPGPGPAPGRGIAVTWGAGALPPGHPAAAFTSLEAAVQRLPRPPPLRCSSSSLSLRAEELELRLPGTTRWQVSDLTSYPCPRPRSLLCQQFKHLSRPCQPQKWSKRCS